MKERVLFVDDEPNILNGLRRMLRSKRANWDLHFANSGTEALQLLQSQPIDIVVSDMKMPVMDGAALLTRISKLHPNTIRIILSGYADKEAVLRTIGPAHQYLAKPCHRDLLFETIKRSLDLRDLLSSEKLRAIANSVDTIPTPSSVFNKLIQELSNSSTTTDRIVAIIESDLSLAANFLKLTNSAYFGLGGSDFSLKQAVQQLGIETIKAITMVAGTFHCFEGSAEDMEEISAIGQKSILTGQLSHTIARKLDLEARLVDQAYIAGTMSQIGTLLLLTSHTKVHRELQKLAHAPNIQRVQRSRQLIGASIGEVGGYLLGIWGFTDPIVEAVVFASTPSECSAKQISPLTCVHLAQAFAAGGDNSDSLDDAYLSQMGLSDRLEGLQDACQSVLNRGAAAQS